MTLAELVAAFSQADRNSLGNDEGFMEEIRRLASVYCGSPPNDEQLAATLGDHYIPPAKVAASMKVAFSLVQLIGLGNLLDAHPKIVTSAQDSGAFLIPGPPAQLTLKQLYEQYGEKFDRTTIGDHLPWYVRQHDAHHTRKQLVRPGWYLFNPTRVDATEATLTFAEAAWCALVVMYTRRDAWPTPLWSRQVKHPQCAKTFCMTTSGAGSISLCEPLGIRDGAPIWGTGYPASP